MPEAQTVIVFGHHIVTADEWIWREDTEGRYFCAADDHMNSVIENIFGQIQDHENKIAPYPHESGLQFRYVAQAAGLGRIGRNSYLLHPDWGPWIHLRVFATTAGINGYVGEIKEGICEECEKCVKVCPADAFENGFDGLQCRKHRKSHGDYIPAGKDRTHKGCKLCALVCKTGKRPAGKFPGLKANL
ncbi:MAG: hypothetical protein GY863_04200 [bacterium]|nr:hypothetical protein [bacterium]